MNSWVLYLQNCWRAKETRFVKGQAQYTPEGLHLRERVRICLSPAPFPLALWNSASHWWSRGKPGICPGTSSHCFGSGLPESGTISLPGWNKSSANLDAPNKRPSEIYKLVDIVLSSQMHKASIHLTEKGKEIWTVSLLRRSNGLTLYYRSVRCFSELLLHL